MWLVPGTIDGVARMQGIITELSERHNSPIFAPHITLCTVPSDTPVEKLKDVAANLPAVELVRFDAVETGGTFYQSVFVAIHPSDELRALQSTVFERLGLENVKMPNFPHLSLYYGDDAAKKTAIRDRLHADGIVQRCEAGGVTVDSTERFPINEVWITRCDGPVADWQVLARVPLE